MVVTVNRLRARRKALTGLSICGLGVRSLRGIRQRRGREPLELSPFGFPPGALSAAAGFPRIPAGASLRYSEQSSWTVLSRPHKSKKIEAISSLLQLRVSPRVQVSSTSLVPKTRSGDPPTIWCGNREAPSHPGSGPGACRRLWSGGAARAFWERYGDTAKYAATWALNTAGRDGDCNFSAQDMRLRIDARCTHSELAMLRFARLR